MSYFTTHLSFTLLVKEFLRLVNEHLAKSRAKSLTMSYTPFALHFCPQRCRSRQINWITCVLQTKTVIKRCYVNSRLMWVNYQEVSNCCRPVLTYWLTDWRRQRLTDCWSCTAFCRDSFSLSRQLCTVGYGIFFYMANVNNFLLVN